MKLYVNKSILVVTPKNTTFSIFCNVLHFIHFDILVAKKGVTSDYSCKKFYFITNGCNNVLYFCK